MSKKELWDECLRLQEKVDRKRKEEKQFEMEMHMAQKAWDKSKRELEETRAAIREKLRIKLENKRRHQEEIREWEQKLKTTQAAHSREIAELKMASFATKSETLVEPVLSELQRQKERKEAIAQILITNFKKKHQRELQELNESHEMQVTEMITFYEHKMRIMADESRKETQDEVDEIDAKYRKLVAEIAAEIDEILIENGKLFEKSLEIKDRRKRLEEEIKQNEEIDRQLTEALQDLQEMKDSIKCLRVRRQQLPDKVRKRILEKILDKALDMLEKHLDVMEADRDVRFTEGDIHQFLEDWRLGGHKERERMKMAAVGQESLTAWLMSAVGDKDQTAAEKIKELIRTKRATRKALKQDLSQLLKEYDDLVRRARGSGKTPPTFNFLKLIRDSLKNTSQNKVLPVLKMIDHVMSRRAAEHLETGTTTSFS